MSIQLKTQRLHLWPCTPEDVDQLHALWRDPAVRRYLFDDVIIERQKVEQFVDEFSQSQAERGLCLWKLETRTEAKLAGFSALKLIPGTREVELYYGLAPEFWGQGLATEAGRAVLEYGFEVLGLPRIWARTDPPNTASKRVAARLGMKPADDPSETSFVSAVIERDAWNI